MSRGRRKAKTKTAKRLITIHSQKGGVGKTMIALYLARKFAQQVDGGQGVRTVLLDADLTGTSLAEALPLRAPKITETGFHEFHETRDLLREISQEPGSQLPWSNPEGNRVQFLNDLLFCDPIRYGNLMDNSDFNKPSGFNKRQLLWKIADPREDDQGGNELGLLRVIPSSAMPRHIDRCIPYVYKEAATGFLENRLAQIVISLWTEDWGMGKPFDVIVIDTPPVIKGISRAVLELADDKPRTEDKCLSDVDDKTGGLSEAVRPHELRSTAIFVSSADVQDFVALTRTLDESLLRWSKNAESSRKGRSASKVISEDRVRLLLNRIPAVGVETGNGLQLLKERYTIVNYYTEQYLQYHSPQYGSLKRASRGKNALTPSPLAAKEDRTFTITVDEVLGAMYVGRLQMERFLYSGEIDEGIEGLGALYRSLSNEHPEP
ncbi:MAG: P-loop NTPase [Thermodesulfobacteriota bacterium]